jgi:hypothetical protein
VPVTAKLSRKFYERLGDDIANELVDWFNAVDASYQFQLKDVNELNWTRVQTRFDAFDERIEQLGERIDLNLSALETRFDAKLSSLEGRFDAKLSSLEERTDARLSSLEASIATKFSSVEASAMESRLEARIDTRIQRVRSELILWMFGFWTATVVPLAALMLALSGAFRN